MASTFPLVLALAALAAEPDAGPGAGPRTQLSTVSGTVATVAYADRRVTVATEQGTSTLTFDRNTAIYLPQHMGTPRDLAPGQPVRAAFGADGRAYWIEIGSDEAVPPSAAPVASPSGPAVLPPSNGDAAATASASPDAGRPDRGGTVPVGRGQPEPNPGARPDPPPPPSAASPSQGSPNEPR